MRHISDIPCQIIHDLENDAQKAEQFVRQVKAGQTPTIIKDLPEEVVGAFKDVVGIFLKLPAQVVNIAEAAVTGAAHVFNDIENGKIVDDLEKLPGVIASDVTKAWGDLTSGLEDDWKAATHAIACFFAGCPVQTNGPNSCRGGVVRTTPVSNARTTLVPHTTSPAPQRISTVPVVTHQVPVSTQTLTTHVQNTLVAPTTRVQQTTQVTRIQTSIQTLTQAPAQSASPEPTTAPEPSTAPANVGASTPSSQVVGSSDATQLLLRPSLPQLCLLGGFGLVGIAFML